MNGLARIGLGILLLGAAGCQEKAAEADNASSAFSNVAVAEPVPEPTTGNAVCGAQTTYDSIKDIIFDEAVKRSYSDPVPLNDLRRSVGVRMEFPLVKSINEKLQRTDCSGRIVLNIPPGARSAFGGDTELKADVEYFVQPAADGNGNVISAEGFGFVLNRLVEADSLRAAMSSADSGGPQLSRTYNPSFDCGPKLSNVERMICQDEGLAAKDRELSSAFKSRLAEYTGTERSELLSNQRLMLAERARCATISCVSDWYDAALADY